MSVGPDDDPKPFIGKLEVQEGGKAVLAHTIHNLNLNSEPSFTHLGPFDSIPPLPANFMDRPELTEPLVESLLSNVSNIGLTALQGMGGVGKSITALALCHDSRVRGAFPHGIVWLTIGRQSGVSLSQRIEQVATALNQQFRTYNEAAYRGLLRDKAALIVLDDVWTLKDAEPFLPPGGRSRLLYTSRNGELAAPLGAESHEVGVLKPEQARSFLLRWSGRERNPPPEPSCSDILAQCKGLVLALAMIGARLRGQADQEWSFALRDLKEAKLRYIKHAAGYEYETLHASIAVSVDALDSAAKQAYLQLAVLLEDMPAPESLLQELWGGAPEDVHRLARQLVDRSLAGRDAEGSLRLHDLQLDYLRMEHPDPAALALIHATVLRSLHVIERNPEQFSSQMIGRLLPYAAAPGIASFLQDLDAQRSHPHLRSLRSALQPAGGASLRVLEGHSGWVNAVALSADGRRAVSGSGDNTVRVWDLHGSEPPRVLEGHREGVNAVALSADGRRAVSGSYDNTVRVWDLATFRCLSVFTCDACVLSCNWAMQQIAVGDAGGQLHLFRWEE